MMCYRKMAPVKGGGEVAAISGVPLDDSCPTQKNTPPPISRWLTTIVNTVLVPEKSYQPRFQANRLWGGRKKLKWEGWGTIRERHCVQALSFGG